MPSVDVLDSQTTRSEFRKHLYDLITPRFLKARDQTALEYAETFKLQQNPLWLFRLTQTWEKLLEEPYKGLTNDGIIRPGLFQRQDEGVDICKIATAATRVFDTLTSEQKAAVSYPIESSAWRAWSNPEILLRPFGLRLEHLTPSSIEAILAVLKASFSAKGYKKALAAMRINHFLGELCQLQKVMNQYSYNFLIFGTPSQTQSWGWSLYGHHLCLNVFFCGSQVVISPTFTGAEPNTIDQGEWKGTAILHEEEALGLRLMQSLGASEKTQAQIFKLLRDPDMLQSGDLAVDRWNQDDQRHVCGAFRDNRVVPYEGVCVDDLSGEQKQLVLRIADEFLTYLPDEARLMKLKQVKRHFSETYFSWIGGFGDRDAFYYRVQSPVIVCEFDHHSGVFLKNAEPAKFHTHTILRTPNAGDYGQALRRAEERLK